MGRLTAAAVTIAQAGVDTWSPSWYVDRDSPAADWLRERATVGAARGRLLPEAIGGHRVGWVPASGLLYAEGHPGGDGLGSPDGLAAALQALELALHERGVPVPVGRAGSDLYGQRFEGFAGVRRLDSTADLAVRSRAEGVAIMAGVAAVARDAPRMQAVVRFARDGRQVETVEFKGHGGRNTLGRWYDKGRESGTAAAGRLLRPEDQRRFVKETRRGVEELTTAYVRGKFVQRFAPLWRASKGVTVGGPVILAERLAQLVEAEELTRREARNVAGEMLLGLVEGPGLEVSRWTRQRHAARLRDLGLVLGDSVLDEVEVDLSDVLEAALDSDAWGAEG